jgi:hypothetical protein
VGTLAVHCPRLIAIVASDDQAVVSVPSLPEPGVELASATDAECAPVRRAIVVHVIQGKKCEAAFAATHAAQVACRVVQ